MLLPGHIGTQARHLGDLLGTSRWPLDLRKTWRPLSYSEVQEEGRGVASCLLVPFCLHDEVHDLSPIPCHLPEPRAPSQEHAWS